MYSQIRASETQDTNVLPSSEITEATVRITEALSQRPVRQPNFEAENRALQILAQQLAGDTRSLLKTLTTLALDLCQADTVSISFLEFSQSNEPCYQWLATSGTFSQYEGRVVSGDCPCSTTLQARQPQLYRHPERYFDYLKVINLPIAELLLIPLYADQQPLGTIWLITHDSDRHFDAEDQRIMTNLSGFLGAALANLRAQHLAEKQLQQEQAAQAEISKVAQRAIDILESTTDCFVSLDRDWRIIYVNQATARLNNLSPKEIIGKTHWEMWSWSVGTIVEQNYRQAVKTQTPAHFEVLYEPLMLWLEIHAYPSNDGLNLFFRDISDRKTAEATLNRQFAEIEAIYNTAPIGLAVFDLDLRFVRINQQLAEINGRSLDDHIGRTVREIVPNLADEVEPLFHRLLAAGEPLLNLEISGETVAQPGIKQTWIGNWFPLRDATGQIIGINAVVQEITSRKQSEAKLSESEERLRLALVAANQGLYDLNVQTGDAIVSPEYAQMLGYDPETFVETNAAWHDRLHPDDWERVGQTYLDYITGKTSEYRVEFRQRTRSGNWKWILSLGRIAAWDSEGQPLRMLGTHTDIDDRKAAEAEREQLLLREQTAREEAEKANQIKDEFLAVLSHELRTPLNPILGWIRLLQAGRLDADRMQQAFHTIERNAQLQTQLIDDLLDVSRILRGKLKLDAAPVNLETVIESAIDTIRLAAEAKSIQIETVLEPIGTVIGDAGRLQQVVWNLLTNAVKFTPNQGQVKVRLSAADSQAEVQVIDSGKGISAEFLPQVFERFQQADSSTTRQFGGLGLGLAIARQLVELHGGTITADSPGEEQGATFTVRLPLNQSAHTIAPSVDLPEQSISLRGKQILVVDDEKDARELVQFILEQEGAIVTCAASAIEVLQVLKDKSIDVLVSDIGMPDCDGYELLKQLRSQGKNFPVIALTAYAGEMNQARSRQAGFANHLTKPFDPRSLIDSISGCLC
ncbi:PAS/PAC sensor hybrid histidine kinase [Leptolyngbya sp. NIES-3755]|nr:PAS/PAC sensor hybrid histidine kinase [Leptolyngbya sp. NIES-3755]